MSPLRPLAALGGGGEPSRTRVEGSGTWLSSSMVLLLRWDMSRVGISVFWGKKNLCVLPYRTYRTKFKFKMTSTGEERGFRTALSMLLDAPTCAREGKDEDWSCLPRFPVLDTFVARTVSALVCELVVHVIQFPSPDFAGRFTFRNSRGEVVCGEALEGGQRTYYLDNGGRYHGAVQLLRVYGE